MLNRLQDALSPFDVADSGQVENAATQFETKFGPIDIWVNNAMTTVFSPFREITAEEFKRASDLSWDGIRHYVRATANDAAQSGRYRASRLSAGVPRDSLQAPYCGAKHAIRGFTDSVRSELIHDGSKVHITMVQLPALNTPLSKRSLAGTQVNTSQISLDKLQ